MMVMEASGMNRDPEPKIFTVDKKNGKNGFMKTMTRRITFHGQTARHATGTAGQGRGGQ